MQKSKYLKSQGGAGGGKKKATSTATSQYKHPEADKKWNYRIKFDVSLQLDEIWIDSQTLDYLNSYRENIFVS